MSDIIGLTGGIGCGKSLVSQYLLAKNYTVIDADQIARQIMEPGNRGLLRTAEAFGSDILRADGTLDRAKLGDIVFNDQALLERLNAITHPLIRQEIVRQILAHQEEPVVFLDVALLLESGGYAQMVDEVWVVAAAPKQQLERIMARDALTREQAMARMDKQWSTERKAALADYVIDNSGDMADTYLRVDALLQRWQKAPEPK